MLRSAWILCTVVALAATSSAAEPRSISGIYPSLTMFNAEGECGTGAVVPWADRLWVITYAPHQPHGSSDKLYEITNDLRQTVRPESVGGTPANRMIHRESQQLFIGPYIIDAGRNVRVIKPKDMVGRLTGNARHLFDPANKIYYATMEEGLYEVDVKTLAVKELYADPHRTKENLADLPGYHGKGLYTAQGKLVYANNGENSPLARAKPDIPSGCLAEWDGKTWTVVKRNQFTEVTGPGGIYGNEKSTDPLWTIGWDHRSLMLLLLDGGKWHTFRLPKGSHSYDGAHGWNTEWPRIREIGERDFLMTMHGTLWKFPPTFAAGKTAGITPRSNYLKVVGDFCRWQDRIVFGCDDTAKNEFLNKRKAKGEIAGPQSQSNLWFVAPGDLDNFGPVIGRGAVWFAEDVAAKTPSDPYLLSGYGRRGLHLTHDGAEEATIALEIDAAGTGEWKAAREIKLAAKGATWIELKEEGAWCRLVSSQPLKNATAYFAYANHDRRDFEATGIFEGLATPGEQDVVGGLLRARDGDKRTLSLAATNGGYYELSAELELAKVDDPKTLEYTKEHTKIPAGVLTVDAASVIFTDDNGKRYRLPRGAAAFDQPGPFGAERIDREVATERDLFNAHGTFYELPAENAGGFAKVRPVATHNRRIHDYCSYRGLFVMTGVSASGHADNPHVIRSADKAAAVWVGAIDDVWKLGKPRGVGGPWMQSAVKAGEPSDPYLMTAYDLKRVTLEHDAPAAVKVTLEVDLTGSGLWREYHTVTVEPGAIVKHTFPEAFQAYWLRARTDRDCRATVQLDYQ